MFDFDLKQNLSSEFLINVDEIKIPYSRYFFKDVVIDVIVETDKYVDYAEKLMKDFPQNLKTRYALRVPLERIKSVLGILLLKEELGAAVLPEITFDKNGKPCSYKKFNISHSDNICVFACFHNNGIGDSAKNIGIDVQKKIKFNAKLLDFITSESERAEFKRIENNYDKDWLLTRLWTRKESLIKMTGQSVGSTMYRFETQSTAEYKIYSTKFAEEYCISLCVESIY